MDERGRFDEPAARRLFVQLVSALAHVHSRGVFHRDVKPENLLLDEHGDLKLTDFGLCVLADRHLGADGLAATSCGSPAYVAPEILYKKRYDAGKVDVWSSGVALFSLTAGYLPFNDGNLMGMYRKIFSGRFRCPRWFSPELRSLIGRMLDPDADMRIKICEIMEHPWVQQDGTSSFDIIQARSSDPRPEVMKWEAEMEQVRELNAFDIIAFASGCDLSGLFGPLPDRVRFAVQGVDIGSVLDKAEEIGRKEGFTVRRKEEVGCGGVMFEAIGREVIALVRVSRLLEEMLMVEVERASSSEAPNLWERLQLGLKLSND
ncbi:hypothetical protein CFC21_026255 [Triticum aestivum]|nr:hypothetical protein CFC21_026255 [Triticum aestivum]